jgi:hypothetical protein
VTNGYAIYNEEEGYIRFVMNPGTKFKIITYTEEGSIKEVSLNLKKFIALLKERERMLANVVTAEKNVESVEEVYTP